MPVPPFFLSVIESSHALITCAVTDDFELLGQLVAGMSTDEMVGVLGAMAALTSSLIATIGDMSDVPALQVWQLLAKINAETLAGDQ